MLVAEELDLDVAGPRDVLLQEDVRNAEGRAGLAASLVQRLVELVRRRDDAHAAAAAAHRRLDDDRIADLAGESASLSGIAHGRLAARQHGNAGLPGDAAGDDLVAELLEDFGSWPDEDQAGLPAGPGEARVLRKEAVSRMDRVHVELLRQRDGALDIEIGADRLARFADAVGLVRLEAVQGEAVLMRIDRNRADAQLVRRAEDADGDFAAVGDQQLANRPNRRLRHNRHQTSSRGKLPHISRRASAISSSVVSNPLNRPYSGVRGSGGAGGNRSMNSSTLRCCSSGRAQSLARTCAVIVMARSLRSLHGGRWRRSGCNMPPSL